MIVMPSNNGRCDVHHAAGRYPGQLGHLYSPGGQRGPHPWLPYALDNGRFGAWANGTAWRESAWRALLEWARNSGQAPRWVLVPDVVADPAATLAEWRRWAPVAAAYGWPLAFAAQDGHRVEDVPSDANVVFLGGTTDWKRQAIRPWCERFPRIHVGRINTHRWLRYCAAAGAESVDGTGWLRAGPHGDQWQGMLTFLAEQAGEQQVEDQQTIEGIA